MLHQFTSPLPDRLKMGIHALHGQRFALHAGNGGLGATMSDVSQAFGIAENLVQVAHRTAVRASPVSELGPVCDAVLDFLFDFFRFIAQQDGVAVRL